MSRQLDARHLPLEPGFTCCEGWAHPIDWTRRICTLEANVRLELPRSVWACVGIVRVWKSAERAAGEARRSRDDQQESTT